MQQGQQQVISKEQLREHVVRELGIEDMPYEEQSKFINEVSEALMERATLALLKELPVEVVAELSARESQDEPEAVLQKVQQYIPNPQPIIERALKEGVEIYKNNL